MDYPPPIIACSVLCLVHTTVLALPRSASSPIQDEWEEFALHLEAALLADNELAESSADSVLASDDDTDEDETLWGVANQDWDGADRDVNMADTTQDSADECTGEWCDTSGGVRDDALLPLPATVLGDEPCAASTAGAHEQRKILPLPKSTRPDVTRQRRGDVEGRGGVRELPALTIALVSLAVGGSRKRKAATDESPRSDVTSAFAEIRELKRPKVEVYFPFLRVPLPVQRPRGPLFPPFYGWGVATMSRPQQVVDPWGHLQGQEWLARRRLQGPATAVEPPKSLALMRPSAFYARPSWW